MSSEALPVTGPITPILMGGSCAYANPDEQSQIKMPTVLITLQILVAAFKIVSWFYVSNLRPFRTYEEWEMLKKWQFYPKHAHFKWFHPFIFDVFQAFSCGLNSRCSSMAFKRLIILNIPKGCPIFYPTYAGKKLTLCVENKT
jgi:hypothetical protein